MQDDELRKACLAVQRRLPANARFTHLTAALLRGWWIPPLPADLPLFIAMDKVDPRPRRRGLLVTRHGKLSPPDLLDVLRVDSPEEVLLACARDLSDLDLLVLIDSALHKNGTTIDGLETVAARRRRGAPRLRRVLPHADRRSESAWETVLRELHRVCEIQVEPQHDVHDAFGTHLARGDMWLVGTRTLHEYDGADHRSTKGQRKDLKRDARLGRADWIRRGYTAVDVISQAIGILRDADASLGRPHDPSRIRAWYDLLRESLFTPAGRSVFRRRLGLPPESGQSAA